MQKSVKREKKKWQLIRLRPLWTTSPLPWETRIPRITSIWLKGKTTKSIKNWLKLDWPGADLANWTFCPTLTGLLFIFFPLPIITPIFWILSSFYWCFVKDIFLVKCFISDSDRGSLRFSRRVCCLEVMSIVSSSRPGSILAPDLVHTFKEEFDFIFFVL